MKEVLSAIYLSALVLAVVVGLSVVGRMNKCENRFPELANVNTRWTSGRCQVEISPNLWVNKKDLVFYLHQVDVESVEVTK